MVEVKTAAIPLPVAQAGRLLGETAKRIGPGAKKLLFGAGELPGGMERIVGRYGGLDYDLLRGKQIREQLRRAGYAGDMPYARGAGDIDAERLGAVEESMPTFWGSIKGHDPEAMASGLREAGVDLTTEQAKELGRQYGPVRAFLRGAKNIYIGDAPLATTYQRFLQGGLIGKGGVLLGEAAPGGHIPRNLRRAYDLARQGQYRRAWKAAPLGHTLGYGANVGFGYAFPAYLGYEAYRAAEQQGQDPLAALGASATSALGGIAMAPLGLAQMQLFGPMEQASQKLWGVSPRKMVGRAHAPATAPQAAPQQPPPGISPEAMATLRRRAMGPRPRPTGYQAALHNTMPPRSY